MLGRYFARFDESPTRKMLVAGIMSRNTGEKDPIAQETGSVTMMAEQEAKCLLRRSRLYVPYAGMLKDNLDTSLAKLRSTMCSCGSSGIEEFQKKARLVVVSATSIVEGGAHDVIQKDNDRPR